MIWLPVLFIVYAMPSILAWRLKRPNGGVIALVNLVLGWTVVGWLVALVMALADPPLSPADQVARGWWLASDGRWYPPPPQPQSPRPLP